MSRSDTGSIAYRARSTDTGVFGPLLIYVGLGLLVGIGAGARAALALLSRVPASFAFDPYLSVAPRLVVSVAGIGGVLAGWFVAALVLWRAPGRVRRPRCGRRTM